KRRKQPRALRPRQRPRQQPDIRGNRKAGTFRKRDRTQNPQRVWLVGGVDTPIVDTSEHAAMKHLGKLLSIAETAVFSGACASHALRARQLAAARSGRVGPSPATSASSRRSR